MTDSDFDLLVRLARVPADRRPSYATVDLSSETASKVKNVLLGAETKSNAVKAWLGAVLRAANQPPRQ